MEYLTRKSKLPTKPARLDASEKSRLLMQYAGIFPNNIKEFGEKLRKHKPVKNFAR